MENEDCFYINIDSYINQEIWEDKESHAHVRFLISIIERAINDLQFLYNQNATKKQKELGRNAFVWLFIERKDNINKLYENIPSEKHSKIYHTSFDHICSILDIVPKYFREKIKIYTGFYPADIFY